jgi:hypothetical protein
MRLEISMVMGILAAGGIGFAQEKPVTTWDSEAGKLLLEWAAKDEAAGHAGDSYDNRDGAHSMLNTGLFPRMSVITYSEEEKKKNLDKGLAMMVRPPVVLGNASMSSPVLGGGSLPRVYYTHGEGLRFLLTQYRSANLYIYPEHLDYDPGENGTPGYGDLYPANTPYLVISQGSSGSDQVFLKAFAATLAAFRPEVKDVLKKTGMLMPTMQMIFRRSNKMAQEADAYFSGVAHPTVFDGAQVDAVAMVKAAHNMTVDTIPPVALLEVVGENEPIAGRDFFERPEFLSEKLHLPQGPEPAVARIFRGTARERFYTVKAKSVDIKNRPLTYRWVVLRGNRDLVKITPAQDTASAEIVISWHPRFRVPGNDLMETHRVDIGVFADNGQAVSPPAFFTCYMLPNEYRMYAQDGRVLMVDYAARSFSSGFPPVTDGAWVDLAARFCGIKGGVGDKLFAEAALPDLKAALPSIQGTVAKAFEARQSTVKAREAVTAVEADRKAAFPDPAKAKPDEIAAWDAKKGKAEEAVKTAETSEKKLVAIALQTLALPVGEKKRRVHELMQQALFDMVDDPLYFLGRQKALLEAAGPDAAGRIRNELGWLASLGVVKEEQGMWLSASGKAVPPVQDRYHFQQLHLLLFAEFLMPEFCRRANRPNLIDPRLTCHKNWRDVYHYSEAGRLQGWTRWSGGKPVEYDALGRVILSIDPSNGQAVTTNVRYEVQGENALVPVTGG